MGLFRVLIYGIMLGVYAGALFYDVRFVPRVGSQLWIQKLVMLSMLNLVCFYINMRLITLIVDIDKQTCDCSFYQFFLVLG